VAGFCLSRLKGLEPANGNKEYVLNLEHIDSVAPTYAKALCNWGRGDDLLEIITEWFRKGNFK